MATERFFDGPQSCLRLGAIDCTAGLTSIRYCINTAAFLAHSSIAEKTGRQFRDGRS